MDNHLTETRKLIEQIAAIGADPAGGMTRLLFDAGWRKAQAALAELFGEAGLTARFDAAGNLFGRIEGSESPGETIMTGSHVDTVRNGGRLDGQYGILAGYLAIKRLIAEHGTPRRSLEVVSFAEEEGSRFPFAFWGSKNLVGSIEPELVRELTDAEGTGFPQAMSEAGFDFAATPAATRSDIVAFLEAHIEQGGVLEHLGKQIGVVTAITGQKRYNVRIIGEANHAGTTPMPLRKDALECAARCITILIDEAVKRGDPLVLTFGKLDPKPNIVNVVPGEVALTLDTRHTDPEALNDFARFAEETITGIAESMGLVAELENWMDEAPVPMDAQLVKVLEKVCDDKHIAYQVMHSGAGHDSQIIAPKLPTAMLFVPSINGISHNPAEDTRIEDLVAGVDVLAEALYRLAYQ